LLKTQLFALYVSRSQKQTVDTTSLCGGSTVRHREHGTSAEIRGSLEEAARIAEEWRKEKREVEEQKEPDDVTQSDDFERNADGTVKTDEHGVPVVKREVLEEIRKEQKEIYDRAKTAGMIEVDKHGNEHFLAPNGRNSKLDKNTWLQSRTRRFKKWFGDWESAALVNMARRAWTDPDYKETIWTVLSDKAASGFEKFLEHKVTTLSVSADLVRHIRDNHGTNEQERVQVDMTPEDIAMIPYVVNECDYMERTPKYDKGGNRAVTVKKRINGVAVVATLERGKDNNAVITGWKFVKSDALDANIAPGPNVRNVSDLAKVHQEIENIKRSAENSSKIVDENGEPLVVYHGTNATEETGDIRFRTSAAEHNQTKVRQHVDKIVKS